jgi:signal transduction histidine kinase
LILTRPGGGSNAAAYSACAIPMREGGLPGLEMDRMAGLLEEVAESTALSIGRPFLTAVVRSMRHALEAKLVFITVGIGAPARRARSVACWDDGGGLDPVEYDLEGTACRMVYDGQTVVIAEGLYKRFSEDRDYEGYLGVPLRGGGQVFGHFAVFSDAPLQAPAEALAILKLFALRAEAELGRIAHERERDGLIASLSTAHRRLSSRHSALRKANELKTQLLHMAAHDLRSPLSVILSRAELIGALLDQDGANATARARESSGIVVETAERMARLIATTLAQAKSDAAAISLNAEDFPADRAFDTAIALNQPAAEKKSIFIARSPPSGLDACGDEDRVVEALDNLISNAIKYSHPGQRIETGLHREAGAIAFTVSDAGLGLSAEDIARAGRPFERLSSRPTAGESSTGLGLSIVKAIAEAHGGQVRVESAGKGMGAVFSLALPMTGE